MPRKQNRAIMEMEGLVNKIRKRGCSTSSSSSSRVYSQRFKRGILVGKKARGGAGLGGSRSNTPVPSWKMTPARSAVESPKYSQKSNGGGRSQPVSARKLAATLWEMNELPTPKLSENLVMEEKSRFQQQFMLKKEKLKQIVPPHLSDPAHSPISERMGRSSTGSYQRRQSSISQMIPSADNCSGAFDSRSTANLMEMETRSRAQTPSRSVGANRLKDISNALTTSKELLKIINRIWAKADQPSANVSLISALHAELERARLQVNQLIHEQRSDQQEINSLLKCFAEEKTAWKNKERQAVKAAIENITSELEVERKLRKRYEGLNKKLGKELSETKECFIKVVKDLEREKRAKEIIEQVCDELARDSGEDKALVEELKRDAEKVREEVEKEREMLHVADLMREERVQMKLLDAKHQFEEKNTAVDKLRKQLEAFLRKGGKEKKPGCLDLVNGEASNVCFSRSSFASSFHGEEPDDDGEVEDVVDNEEDSAESEMHSIELNMDNSGKSYKWAHISSNGNDLTRSSVDDEGRGRSFIADQMARRCSLLQRSSSDGIELGAQARSIPNRAENLIVEKISELEKRAQRNSSADETQRNKAVEGLRNQVLLSRSRTGSGRDFGSPTKKWEQPWPSREACSMVQERSNMIQGSSRKSRLSESVGESRSVTSRRSKR